MGTLSEFLLARIAEREAAANTVHELLCLMTDYDSDDRRCTCGEPERVLSDCKAKRRIVEDFEALHRDYRVTRDPATEARRYQAAVAVAHLATVFADHPDYRDEWRP